MALSDELILDLAGLAPNRRVCASTCMARKIDKKPCQCYPGMRNDEALALARAIEAEVRKDDEALIRQLVEALEASLPGLRGLGLISPTAAEHAERHAIVIAAARARLEKAP